MTQQKEGRSSHRLRSAEFMWGQRKQQTISSKSEVGGDAMFPSTCAIQKGGVCVTESYERRKEGV